MPTVLVPLFTGFEEIEAITIIDVLRRADIEVITASLDELTVMGAHAIAIIADKSLDQVESHIFDAIALPGGAGTFRLREDPRVAKMLTAHTHAQKLVAAICAAPTVLSAAGLLKDKRATSFPAVKSQLQVGEYLESPVVVDGNVVTSRGAGTAMAFALKLVEILNGAAIADQIATSMIVQPRN
ncbi:DJ-1/PfpI family protein [Pseudanabaena sp. FACHB-1277]|jgi:4-methyl-5(b-hydroxyethyl)-thiazole monophosphate biosynthesis|uniref:DJ-1/PfpI family protein n=1 Tax=Pseudanabaena cinerea FACHB-1277 TaxID=2949581 RepID=A0A926UPP6_9CYAN|nr:DJ-1 family glyoxalase III [Pseudanabaena cinerea]MBD2148727.1 DJ-1/PfpI family protein [Pseudanabaena cinerea FACHB-1277]